MMIETGSSAMATADRRKPDRDSSHASGGMIFIVRVAAALLLAAPAFAADRTVQLRTPPPLAPEQASMPRIAGATGTAERRINAALGQLDTALRRAVASCRDDAAHDTPGRGSLWHCTVEVPMQGPGFLSILVTDDVDCGGAHSYGETWAIVYDLRTGRPVDWAALLPPGWAGAVTAGAARDGTKTVAVASRQLYRLYLASYDHGSGDKTEDDACRAAVTVPQRDGPPAMILWLDAKAGGLQMVFPLGQAMDACAEPQLVPAAALRQAGASAILVAALDAAHRSR